MSIAPPAQGRAWNLHDLPALPDDARYEVLDGRLLVSPLEREVNVWAGVRLAQQLRPQIRPPWSTEREIAVRLGEDALIPDVIVLRPPEHGPGLALGIAPEDVALIVEIVSPTSRRRDRFLKPPAYAEAGIPAFWRLEVEPVPRLHAFVLAGAGYVEQPESDVLHLPAPLEVTVRLDLGHR